MVSEIPEGMARLTVALAAVTNTHNARAVMNEVTDLIAAGVQAGREAAAQAIEDYAARLDARPRNTFNELRKAAHIARGLAVPQEGQNKVGRDSFDERRHRRHHEMSAFSHLTFEEYMDLAYGPAVPREGDDV